ncbi:MAG: PAS domain S-box [Ignavibacteria bacterium]|nr:MAG: PAS domain S-box [Ignavibacteria bacterium]KAF0160073.1 MAG: PAS domain S-box [Ignavibacteria bacterium]
MKYKVTPNNKTREMRDDDFIVSKTDLKGKIEYANRIFMEFAQMSEQELLGQPHNVIRHPDMPRAIFKLLWDTVQSGKEIFAYVKNMAKDGSAYWVLANVTPVRNDKEEVVGFYSVRRKPSKKALDAVIPIYKAMLEEEKRNEARNQIESSTKILQNLLQEKGMSYEEFVLSI